MNCRRHYNKHLHHQSKQKHHLFIHLSGCPVSRYQAESVFNKAMKLLGLDTKIYKTHYIRIGTASNAYASGMSQKDIAGKGHSKSRCKYRCIRI